MKAHQSYAPFGSVSTRVRKIKSKQQKPGPGSYEVSLPLIHPIVQTIRKKNNNVIVKLGHIGTASFQSDQQRFKENDKVAVGPGQYSPQKNGDFAEKQKMNPQRNIAVSKIKELIKNQPSRRAAIEEVRQLQITEYVQMPAINKKKQQFKKGSENVKGSIWSRMTEERGKDMKIRSVSNIGPGQYNPKGDGQKDVPSAAFKSQSIRSFFDQIYFQTNQEKIAKQRQQNKYKASRIGPGNYNLAVDKLFFHKYQFFGSTQQRKLM